MPSGEDTLFGEIAVEKGFLTPEQVEECVQAQKVTASVGINQTLGEVAAAKKYLDRSQVRDITREAMKRSGKRVKIGNYEVVAKLGQGGMGAVYKAELPATGKAVAVKVLPPQLAKNAEFVARFRREADVAARLDHPNIVRAIEAGESGGYHYFAMEFVEGESVYRRLKREGVVPEGEALQIARHVALALQHAHGAGLVHRDIKPDNIFLATDGQAKLGDLGLARETGEESHLTRSGVMVGTPHYVSPEQAKGSREVDTRSDIYSLGATLYHMVTGQVPFEGDTAMAVLNKHLNEELPWPADINDELTDDVCLLIAKMMAKDPADRYQEPLELIGEMDRVIRGEAPASQVLDVGRSSVKRAARARKAGEAAERRRRRLEETPRPSARRAGAIAGTSSRMVPARKSSGALVAGVVAGVVLLVVAAVIVMSGPSDTGTSLPVSTGPKPPGKRGDEPEKRLAESYGKADAFWKANPEEYEEAIARFAEVESAARGTKWQKKAAKRLAEVKEARRLALFARKPETSTLPPPPPLLPPQHTERPAPVVTPAPHVVEEPRPDPPDGRAHLRDVLDEAETLALAGKFDEARGKLAAAKGEKALAEFADEIAAAVKVVDELSAASRAAKSGFTKAVGREIEVTVGGKPKLCKITKVLDDCFEAEREVRMGGRKTTMTFQVKFTDLETKVLDSLRGRYEPKAPDGHVAAAVLALSRKDFQAAGNSLGRAGKHPLVPHYEAKLAALSAPSGPAVPAPGPKVEILYRADWDDGTGQSWFAGTVVDDPVRGKVYAAGQGKKGADTTLSMRSSWRPHIRVARDGYISFWYYLDKPAPGLHMDMKNCTEGHKDLYCKFKGKYALTVGKWSFFSATLTELSWGTGQDFTDDDMFKQLMFSSVEKEEVKLLVDNVTISKGGLPPDAPGAGNIDVIYREDWEKGDTGRWTGGTVIDVPGHGKVLSAKYKDIPNTYLHMLSSWRPHIPVANGAYLSFWYYLSRPEPGMTLTMANTVAGHNGLNLKLRGKYALEVGRWAFFSIKLDNMIMGTFADGDMCKQLGFIGDKGRKPVFMIDNVTISKDRLPPDAPGAGPPAATRGEILYSVDWRDGQKHKWTGGDIVDVPGRGKVISAKYSPAPWGSFQIISDWHPHIRVTRDAWLSFSYYLERPDPGLFMSMSNTAAGHKGFRLDFRGEHALATGKWSSFAVPLAQCQGGTGAPFVDGDMCKQLSFRTESKDKVTFMVDKVAITRGRPAEGGEAGAARAARSATLGGINFGHAKVKQLGGGRVEAVWEFEKPLDPNAWYLWNVLPRDAGGGAVRMELMKDLGSPSHPSRALAPRVIFDGDLEVEAVFTGLGGKTSSGKAWPVPIVAMCSAAATGGARPCAKFPHAASGYGASGPYWGKTAASGNRLPDEVRGATEAVARLVRRGGTVECFWSRSRARPARSIGRASMPPGPVGIDVGLYHVYAVRYSGRLERLRITGMLAGALTLPDPADAVPRKGSAAELVQYGDSIKKRSATEAHAVWRAVVLRYPRSVKEVHTALRWLSMWGAPGEAIKLWETVRDGLPKAEVLRIGLHRSMANAYAILGMKDEAIEGYRFGGLKSGFDIFGLANVHFLYGEYDDAIKYYEMDAARSPNDWRTSTGWLRLGHCYRAKGNPRKAVECYRNVLAKFAGRNECAPARKAIAEIERTGR